MATALTVLPKMPMKFTWGIAFGFAEVVNPACEEGTHMHPVAWTLTSLDAATETKIRALLKKAVA